MASASNDTRGDLAQRIRRIVDATPITDIHTHLYAPCFGGLLLRGIDDLLTYHYLVAEMFRWCPDLEPHTYFAWDVPTQAEHVWKTLFIDHSPVSESARGLLASLKALGLDPGTRDLNAYRESFAGLSASEHIDLCMQAGNIDTLVMTNSPFDPEERPVWEQGVQADPRFRAALRIDNLFVAWPGVAQELTAMGFPCTPELTAETREAIKNFLEHWIEKMAPLYVMASLPPDFVLPDEGIAARVLQEIVLPLLEQKGLPFAAMIGCRRQINPAFRLAGDGVGKMEITTLIHLARAFPRNRFLVTLLSRENQHELCIVARKFNNLMPFGCWWYMNSPELINEISRMRLEWLGTSMIPQHSDARVLDQIIYKWNNTKAILSGILTEKYGDIQDTGWQASDAEIERDVRNMFRDNFWNFIGGER